MLSQLSGSRAMPEFDEGLLTIRWGTQLVRIMADDSLGTLYIRPQTSQARE
jgi:hypothetical protein